MIHGGLRSLLCAFLLFQSSPAWAGALERAMLGKSAVVDLTHVVSDHVEGSSEIQRADQAADTEGGGPSGCGPAAERGTQLRVGGGTGHGVRTVARIPSRELLVPAVVVNITEQVAHAPDYHATLDDLRAWERKNGRIPKQAVVLLHTGWAKRWPEAVRYANQDAHGASRAPGFSPSALAFLADERHVRGFGVDALIPDGSAAAGPDHGPRAAALGMWQIDNLVDLDRLPAKGAKLVIAPLRIDAQVAPVRVLAILP